MKRSLNYTVADQTNIYNFILMDQKIEINPSICHGKPVIRGTRVLVSTILGAFAGGDTSQTILEDYPTITEEDIHAALEFASEATAYQTIPYDTVA